MRDTTRWRKKLCKALFNSDDLKEYVVSSLPNANQHVQDREVRRLAQLIAEVELGLSLLQEVAPEEPATSVEALLKGYRFPVAQLQSNHNWQLIQNARFYLIHRKGRQWLRVLQEYINLPEIIRIYSLEDASSVPQLIPSSTYPNRLQDVYLPTLSETPEHKTREVELATAGRWYVEISHKGNSPVEIPIDISSAVADIARSPTVFLHHTRTNRHNPLRTATFEELLLAAEEMDYKLSELGKTPHYHTCLQSLTFQLYNPEPDNFHPGTALTLEGLIHIVGLLNVGKSTLLEILTYFFAKQGYRCALMVNDVTAAVRIASMFAHQLEIPAAPVLGSRRQEQLDKVYEPILKSEGREVTEGGIHPAWRWFSPVCPLLALVQSEEKWEFGQEPCHKLYQKVPLVTNDNSDNEDEERESKKYTCPLYYNCPRHQLEKDIAKALVWVLTPASFIRTRVPRQFEHDLTFAEAVYRECDFLFVDEADRVQVQFDEAFAPDEVLVDASGNSFLNKLGLIFANTVYNSDRSNMAASLLAAGKRANDYAQIATDLIYNRLYNHPKLVEWLGSLPFTGRSLFARIIRDLVDPNQAEASSTASAQPRTRQELMSERRRRIIEADLSPTEQRHRRKQMMDELDKFLQAPLNRNSGKELSDLALTILSAENDRQAIDAVAKWCEKWLEDHNLFLPDEAAFEELTCNTHFAILIAVLDNRLGFLVDNRRELEQAIDLHDLSQDLLDRPPRDYLPILPESPVGNILGFLYKRDRSTKKAGKLDYFRYVGVGRALLLNFPTLFAVDDWQGPHTVLISGTSYAPGSPAYHISIQPTVLLQPATKDGLSGDAGIAESEFVFSPKQNQQGNYIALSGLPSAKRKLAASEMIEAMCHSPRRVTSFLDGVFQDLQQREQEQPEWWSDRSRILIVVGSYNESEWVTSILKSRYRLENIDDDGIATLRRDNAPPHLNGIPRSKIRDLNNTSTRIVVAPLMALERGHNILNNQGKAAFGAVLFLNRPMPVPDNWQSTVQQLNAWALEHEKDSNLYKEATTLGILTLTKVADIFYQNAVAEMVNLNSTAGSFQQLTSEERAVLCWTQLVSIWQIIGRLVRGGVPAKVHFMDVKFAPLSASGEQDSEITSLLVGIIKVLEPYVLGEDKRPCEITIARSLYRAFLNALKQTDKLY